MTGLNASVMLQNFSQYSLDLLSPRPEFVQPPERRTFDSPLKPRGSRGVFNFSPHHAERCKLLGRLIKIIPVYEIAIIIAIIS